MPMLFEKESESEQVVHLLFSIYKGAIAFPSVKETTQHIRSLIDSHVETCHASATVLQRQKVVDDKVKIEFTGIKLKTRQVAS
jgi:hypothetical protein